MEIFKFNDTNIGKCIKGRKLSKIHLCKITNLEENHNGFQFKNGINVDHLDFDPTEACKKGGIYFCQLSNIFEWINYGKIKGHYIRTVTVDFNEDIYVEYNKFKAKKIHLENRVLISEYINNYVSFELCMKEIWYKNENVYEHIPDIIYLEMIKCNNGSLQSIPEYKMTELLCLEAVKNNGLELQFVPTHLKTSIICSEALKQNKNAKKYIDHEDIKLIQNQSIQKEPLSEYSLLFPKILKKDILNNVISNKKISTQHKIINLENDYIPNECTNLIEKESDLDKPNKKKLVNISKIKEKYRNKQKEITNRRKITIKKVKIE